MKQTAECLRGVIEAARKAANAKALPGENAAHSQDFLYARPSGQWSFSSWDILA
jgi:hypothetical protein